MACCVFFCALMNITYHTDQRRLGFTMRVKKSSLSDVKAKFAAEQKKQANPNKKRKSLDMEEYERRLSEKKTVVAVAFFL